MTYNCELHTGQIALYDASSILGRAIAVFEVGLSGLWRRVKTHAGIVLVEGGRHYVLDAVAPRVDKRPISADVAAGYRIKIARAPADVTWNEEALLDFAYRIQDTTPYGFWTMLANAWTEIFGCSNGLLDPVNVPQRFMCSELVSRCCRMFARWQPPDFPCPVPYDPDIFRPDRYTTPDRLDRKSSLVTVTPLLEFA